MRAKVLLQGSHQRLASRRRSIIREQSQVAAKILEGNNELIMRFAGIEPGTAAPPLVPSGVNLGVSYARYAGVISRLPLAVPDLYLFRTRDGVRSCSETRRGGRE